MNFDLSDDQRIFNDQIDRFLSETCPVDRLHKAFDGDAELLASMWRGMLELGLGGVLVPEERDGLGLKLLEAAAISERIGFFGAPGPWISHTLAALAISRAGTEAQKKRWLPKLASGEITGTVALHENDEWRADKWAVPAEARTSGVKDYVMSATEADVIVVGLAGGKLGIVEADAPGVTREAWASTDRTRPVGRLVLDEAPADVLEGAFGARLVDAALVLVAADAHGGAQRARDDIVQYSKDRVQFDRPIARFQAIKHKLADLALWVENLGPLYREAAAAFDQEPAQSAIYASNAKAHITDIYSNTARIATESYGGIGYTWEHWAHIWLRRAMFDFAWLGAPAAHRARVAHLQGW